MKSPDLREAKRVVSMESENVSMNLQANRRSGVIGVVSTNADLAGAPRHVLTLVSALSSSFDIVVIFGESGPVEELVRRNGIRTHILHGMRSQITPLRDMKLIARLVDLIQRERIEVLHCHSTKAAMLGRLSANLVGIPCIYTVHGWGFGPGRRIGQSVIVQAIERLLVSRTSRYLVVSEFDYRLGLRRLGMRPEQAVVVRNGVADSLHRAAPAASGNIVMVARVRYPKDYETLVKAFELLTGKPTLTLVGAGTTDTHFVSLCKKLAPSSSSRIEFIGPSLGVDQILATSGVFALSSRFEALPLSIIEAMRSGLPVVASNVGGVQELVEDGITGFLVESGGTKEMAYSLQLLLNDSKLRANMGSAGRSRYASTFTADRMTAQVRATYLQALGSRPRSPAP